MQHPDGVAGGKGPRVCQNLLVCYGSVRSRGSTAGFIEGIQRDQTVLFPERLEDWLGEDDLVRIVDLFVDELDLHDLGFVRSVSARTAVDRGIIHRCC